MTLTARQAEFADAALGLVAREGMAAVSFRSVAAAAGWSLGALQKAFGTKDELIAAMFTRLRETAVALPAGEPGRPTLRAWLVDLFLLMQPLDAARRDAYARASAFSDRAAHDPAIAAAIAASDAELQGRLALLVRRAQAEGEIPAEVDGESVAFAFLALAQGTAGRLLYDPTAAAGLPERVDAILGALLGN